MRGINVDNRWQFGIYLMCLVLNKQIKKEKEGAHFVFYMHVDSFYNLAGQCFKNGTTVSVQE